MKKKIIAGLACATILPIGYAISTNNEVKQVNNNIDFNEEKTEQNKSVQICDGITITSNCIYDGIEYSIYLYHPEVPEKTHIETEVTYTEEIVGYCTMCNDGTRSPSCSVGRGTCSHHGGVREWNAPIYNKVKHTNEVTVVDSEKVEAYWEKVEK